MSLASSVGPARALRLQKVKESSISAHVLLDRKHREPAPLTALRPLPPKHKKPQDDVLGGLFLGGFSNALAAKKTESSPAAAAEDPRSPGPTLTLFAGGAGKSNNKKGVCGWRSESMVFAQLDQSVVAQHGAMEVMALKSQQGLARERDAARRVLEPRAAQFMRTMDANACAELQRRVFGRLDAAIRALRTKYQHIQKNLDDRRVFHGAANAQRVNTQYLAALRREVNVQAIEEECLAEMMGGGSGEPPSSPPHRERRRRRWSSSSAAAAVPPSSPKKREADKAAKAQPKKKTPEEADEALFESYLKWQSAKDRRVRHSTARNAGLAPLPATRLLAQTFANFGGAQGRLVGGDLEASLSNADLLRRPKENMATGGSGRLKGADVTPFTNAFTVRPPLAAVFKAPPATDDDEDDNDDDDDNGVRRRRRRRRTTNKTKEGMPTAMDDDESPSSSRGAADAEEVLVSDEEARPMAARVVVGGTKKNTTNTSAARRSGATLGGSGVHHHPAAASLDQLQPRLEKVWFALEVTMSWKLGFLQKYASVDYAPLLPRAVVIWEQAAHALTRQAKLAVLADRIAAGEAFVGPDLVAVVERVCSPDPVPFSAPPDLRNATTVVTAAGLYDASDLEDPIVAGTKRSPAPPRWPNSWLADCVAYYARTSDDLRETAHVELHDELPDFSLARTYLI